MRRAIVCLLTIMLGIVGNPTLARTDEPVGAGTAAIPQSADTATPADDAARADAQSTPAGGETTHSNAPENHPTDDQTVDAEPLAPIEPKNPIRTNADVSLPQDI